MASLSPIEHTGIGAFAGIIEVCVMQPTVGIKNALQEGRPVPRNPLALYRGLLVNAGSIAPITAIQFGAHRAIEQALLISSGGKLSDTQQIGAATGAGAASAIIGCPAEVIMIQQQKAGRSLAGEARHFLSQYGAARLYRGLSMTACRDGIYTAGYLGLSPALKGHLEASSALQGYPAAVPFVLAGIASGAFAALVTQPVDTIKTRMQAFVDPGLHPEYRSPLSTARHLISTQGVASLWTGIAPRLVRLCGATMILQVVRTTVIDFVEESRKQKLEAILTS